jgi:polyhydroxyalkanoate synthesis repressor PhaR
VKRGNNFDILFALAADHAGHAHRRLDAGTTLSQTVEVTRYPNRRLYDRNQRQYVTLGDIEEMVRNGKSVRVRDSKTEEDLTRVILMQILIERHPERLQMFPVALLHEILRADQLALDWLTVYLGQAKSFIESLPTTTAADLVPGLDLWKLWMPGSLNRTKSPAEEQPSEEALSEEAPREDVSADSQPPGSKKEMAERLAELERRLSELEANRD